MNDSRAHRHPLEQRSQLRHGCTALLLGIAALCTAQSQTTVSGEERAVHNSWAKVDRTILRQAEKLGVEQSSDLAALSSSQLEALISPLKLVPRRKLKSAVAALKRHQLSNAACPPLDLTLEEWCKIAKLSPPIHTYLHDELGAEEPRDLLQIQTADINGSGNHLSAVAKAKLSGLLEIVHSEHRTSQAPEKKSDSDSVPPEASSTGASEHHDQDKFEKDSSMMNSMAAAERDRRRQEQPCLQCPEFQPCIKYSAKDKLCRRIKSPMFKMGVDLSQSNITDADLSELVGLFPPEMSSLSLDFNKITDISPLVTHAPLNALTLIGNKISRIPAAAMPRGLVFIDLSGNQITDASLVALPHNMTHCMLGSNPIDDPSKYTRGWLPSTIVEITLPNNYGKDQTITIKQALEQEHRVILFENPLDDSPE